jgi:hypothetical protein
MRVSPSNGRRPHPLPLRPTLPAAGASRGHREEGDDGAEARPEAIRSHEESYRSKRRNADVNPEAETGRAYDRVRRSDTGCSPIIVDAPLAA